MSLVSSIANPDSFLLSQDFYHLVESHLDYFRSTPGNAVISATPQQAAKYRGDFYGLLDELAVDKKYQYLIMRLNGMSSSLDFSGEVFEFVTPDPNEIALMIAQHMSTED